MAQLDAKAEALLVFWSRRLSWQLRVRAVTSVQHTGPPPEVDAVWTRVSQSAAAGDSLFRPARQVCVAQDKRGECRRSRSAAGPPSGHHYRTSTGNGLAGTRPWRASPCGFQCQRVGVVSALIPHWQRGWRCCDTNRLQHVLARTDGLQMSSPARRPKSTARTLIASLGRT